MRPLGESGPREVGPYRVLAELGRGGMGRVLLGSGPDGRLVALKLVYDQFSDDEGFRARFRREVNASRSVSGAYTAAVVDADPDASTPWLASVFVPGPSLQETIEEIGALPEQSVLRLTAGLATALVQIHRAELVHRDLKPSNVLLAEDGPRVIDFGIARAVRGDRATALTRTGWLIGSPAFMSPEQTKGEPVTSASDVFSLGSVVVAACTGASPFTGTATWQTLNNVVGTVPDLSDVPAAVRRIVEPCLAKEPAERPTPAQVLDSIGQLAPSVRPWPPEVQQLIARRQADIARLLDQAQESTVVIGDSPPTVTATRVDTGPPEPAAEPGGESPPTRRDTAVADRSAPHRVRRRVLGSGIALTAVALTGILIWSLWPSRQNVVSPPRPSPKIAQIGVLAGASPAEGVVFSPDGRTLAAVFEDETTRVWNVAGRQQISQVPDHGLGSDPVFSPDNRTLITAGYEYNDDGGIDAVVERWNVADGRRDGEPLVVEVHADAGGGLNIYEKLALSPQGRSLAIVAWDKEADRDSVQLWDIDSGQPLGDPVLDEWGAVLNPDERTFVTEREGMLVLRDLASQRPVSCIALGHDGHTVYAFSPDGRTLITAERDGEDTGVVRLWDTFTRRQEHCHSEPTDRVAIPGLSDFESFRQVALSPDGRTVATLERSSTGDEPPSLRLWNADNGRQIGSEIDGVNAIAFGPDGRTLATAGEDHTVRLWNLSRS